MFQLPDPAVRGQRRRGQDRVRHRGHGRGGQADTRAPGHLQAGKGGLKTLNF